MNYLPMMTEDEVRYVCSVIPIQESKEYFKHYPKDFAKVMPGFRATSLTQEQSCNILVQKRNRPFISSFIEKHISRWLDEIGAAINEKIEAGESKESALLQTLPYSFFVDNINLYFKLTNEEYTDEFLSMLRASIKTVKGIIVESGDLKSKLNIKIAEISHLELELERIQNEQSKTSQKLNDSIDEIKTLKQTIKSLEKCKELITSHEKTIEKLKQKVQEKDTSIQQLKNEITIATSE